MADYGFRVLGDSGSIQFSNNIKNMCLAAKGVTTTWTVFTSLIANRRYWEISYTAAGSDAPMIAIAPSAQVTPFGRTVSGSTYTWGFISGGNVNEIPYFIFDAVSVNPGGYGIVVYDNAGDIAYHSSRLPLRIAPSLIDTDMGFDTWREVSAPQIGPTVETWTKPVGRSYAVLFGTVSHYWTYISVGAGQYSLGSNSVSAAISSNIITTSGLWTSRESATTTSPSAAFEVYNIKRLIIPIDVTHY